jgi:hypothetical protein
VLWSRPGRFLTAATEGLAAVEYKKRYTVLSAATGERLAVVPRKGRSSIRAVAGGRFVIDTGRELAVVEPDGTTRHLSAPPGELVAASAQYAVFSKVTDPRSKSVRVTVLDIATGAVVLEHPFEGAYGISIGGTTLVVRHWESATTVDVATGTSTHTGMPSFRTSPPSSDLAVVAFSPDATRLLWATELPRYATVGAIGDAIVVSTPAFKHR